MDGLLYTVGQIFIASLKMLVVPLVFVSLVCGVHGLSDPTKLGRLGGKAILLYVVTTAIAITTAIFFALLVSPGEGVSLIADSQYVAKQAPSLAQVIIDIFPDNPFKAMAQGNMLQVIVFALLFGISIALSGTPLENIQQQGYAAPNFYTKVNLLIHLLKDKETFKKVVVFIDTKKHADLLFDALEQDFWSSLGIIHSNKSQNNRKVQAI